MNAHAFIYFDAIIAVKEPAKIIIKGIRAVFILVFIINYLNLNNINDFFCNSSKFNSQVNFFKAYIINEIIIPYDGNMCDI
ncbi:hypothetical protein CSC2_37220 [Clostridium zeae]|uniref:Uncharacterized protein n=1 Tax=Clostridium zeae TaxID=2759022 RepID=A0ABQ1EEF5_9CLOT|nr:hypothetical protein CSC2_37220 [Clostridium zeae]